MRYEILGPVRITSGDRCSFISARKIELLLIVLLSRANNVVTMDQLISEIWTDKGPQRAVAAVHVYMSQLRKFLDRLDQPQQKIVTRSQGYQMLLEPDELDTSSFLRWAETGRAHTRNQQYELASSAFEKALGIWRGPITWDTDSGSIVKSFATYLTETSLECVEMLLDTQLKLGYHQQLVGRLYTLTVEHPLREAFYQQLMLALYRCNRQADALSVYRSAQRILDDELGVEPCRSLQRIHRGILMADDQLLLSAQSSARSF
jgi:SARP family transcriptional regulator, regulator of embCAB operon